jgi:TIR domain
MDQKIRDVAKDIFRERMEKVNADYGQAVADARRRGAQSGNTALFAASVVQEAPKHMEASVQAFIDGHLEACSLAGKELTEADVPELMTNIESITKAFTAAAINEVQRHSERTGLGAQSYAAQAQLERSQDYVITRARQRLEAHLRRQALVVDARGQSPQTPRDSEEGVGMDSGQPRRVFLCHSSSDKRVVLRLAGDLETSGAEVWIADWEIRAGDSLTEKINAGIEKCDVFIVFVSEQSMNSEWVQRELNAGLVKRIQRNARLIPVRLDQTPVPPLISDLLWVSLADYDGGLKSILDAVLDRKLRPL